MKTSPRRVWLWAATTGRALRRREQVEACSGFRVRDKAFRARGEVGVQLG